MVLTVSNGPSWRVPGVHGQLDLPWPVPGLIAFA